MVLGVLGTFIALLVTMLIPAVLVVIVLRLALGAGKRNQRSEAEDARLMQDLHRSLQKLENRVESLETIMLENESKTIGE